MVTDDLIAAVQLSIDNKALRREHRIELESLLVQLTVARFKAENGLPTQGRLELNGRVGA